MQKSKTSGKVYSRVLNQGQFGTPGDRWPSLKVVLVAAVQRRVVATVVQGVEAGDAVKYPVDTEQLHEEGLPAPRYQIDRRYDTLAHWHKNVQDPWVAQRFGTCLWPRARSWRPGIESHIGLPVHGACFSLCLCLCLSLSVSIINK